MNAPTDIQQLSQPVLRVIAGRQLGAEYRLSAGIQASIGHHLHHDIVLRNSESKESSFELHVSDGIAMLTVVTGEVFVLGRSVVAGETTPLPFFMPVQIGSVVFAIGTPESERWDEAAQISAASADAGANEVTTDNSAVATAVPIDQKIDGAIRHFYTSFRPFAEAIAIERRWPLYAVIAASLFLGLILFAPVTGWVKDQTIGAKATDEMLARNGFPDLAVSEAANDNLIVSGVLANDQQMQKLRRLLDDAHPNAVIDVSTMDALAAGVTDMLVAQNIDAQAKVGRGRTIIISSEYLPGDRQADLAAQIRGDMPAIKNISFQIDPARGEPDLQYFFASEKYGLASFIDGEPSYITTADGTKWFKGAVVPTGHTILSIGNGAISFEREGQIEELRIGAPTTPVITQKQGTGDSAKFKFERVNAERKIP
jgi:type III secretion protein D